MSKFICTRDNEVRRFETFADAQRFCRREGDMSRLWTLDGPGVAERRMADAVAAASRMGFSLAMGAC